MKTIFGLAYLAVLVGAAAGCSSGDGADASGGDPRDRVTPYTVECTQTLCEHEQKSCRDAQDARCDECFNLCLNPYAPAGCAGTCDSICGGDCGECASDSSKCAEATVRFAPPPRNDELYAEALSFERQCHPEVAAPEEHADFIARSDRHEYLDVLKCFEANACVTTDCVGMLEPTPVGQAMCDRQRECKNPCTVSEGRDLEAAIVDHNAPMLRPALVSELRRCAAEPECTVATSCWNALKPAVGLGTYPMSP